MTTGAGTADFLRAFGERLRRERERRGMTQADFGRLVGMERTFYGALERGERGCNISRLPVVSERLGIPMAELLAGEV